MRVFCINLKERADRRLRMEALFHKYGVEDWEFVEASNRTTPQVVEANKRFPVFDLPYLACSDSHAQVWALIAELDAPYALVLEDDVFFHKEWRKLVRESIEALPSDWELFMLDCFYLQGWDWTSEGNCGRVGIHPAQSCSFADAYVITPTACQWLLERQKAALEEGEWLNNETLLMELQDREKSFTFIPKLALQHFDESDIQESQLIQSMDSFYRTSYFPKYPRDLYDD